MKKLISISVLVLVIILALPIMALAQKTEKTISTVTVLVNPAEVIEPAKVERIKKLEKMRNQFESSAKKYAEDGILTSEEMMSLVYSLKNFEEKYWEAVSVYGEINVEVNSTLKEAINSYSKSLLWKGGYNKAEIQASLAKFTKKDITALQGKFHWSFFYFMLIIIIVSFATFMIVTYLDYDFLEAPKIVALITMAIFTLLLLLALITPF